MKQKFLFAVAILVGIVAASLSHFYLQTQRNELDAEHARIRNQYQMVPVVVAYTTLTAGTELKMDDLREMEVSLSATSELNILKKDASRIIGRKLTQSLERGNPVLWSYIEGGKERPSSLSLDIKPGMRAVSIPVSGASGVSGMVRPNDTVDVLGSFALPAAEGGGTGDDLEMVTKTVLQNVTVLAIGSDTHRSIQDNPRGASGGYSTVTLQVTPREAEVMVFAQQMRGRLFLTLRNPTDVYFEKEFPRVDFNQIEKELQNLNEFRQNNILKGRTNPRPSMP